MKNYITHDSAAIKELRQANTPKEHFPYFSNYLFCIKILIPYI